MIRHRRSRRKPSAQVDDLDRMTAGAERAGQVSQHPRRVDVLGGWARPVDHDPPAGGVEVGRDEMGRECLDLQPEPGGRVRRRTDLTGRDPEARHGAGETLGRDP